MRSTKEQRIRETMEEIARRRKLHHQPPMEETALLQAATNIVETWMREFDVKEE